MTSRLCSITTTVLPESTSRCRTRTQLFDVGHVQADGGLVEHVQRVLALAARRVDAERIGAHFRQFGDELDSLAFAARQRRTRLSQTQISEPDVGQQAHRMMHAALGREEFQRVVDAHRERLADVLALEQDRQRFRIEASAAAYVAQDLHIGQEIHLDALHALALAGLAAAAGRVEGEAAGRKPAHPRLGRIRVQPADRVPESDVGGRAGARRLADGSLIDFENAADGLPSGDRMRILEAGLSGLRARPSRTGRANKLLSDCFSSTSRASDDLPDPETPGDHGQVGREECVRRPCADCAASAPVISIDGRLADDRAAAGP